MTTVVINKAGLDQVTLDLFTTGRNEASCNLRHDLLDDRLNYIFTVDSWNIPLDNAPINKATGQELFRIERRNRGESALLEVNMTMPVNPAIHNYIYSLRREFKDVTGFVKDVNNFSRGFEDAFTRGGFTDLTEYGGPHNAANALASIVPPLRALGARNDAQITQLGYYDFIRFRLTVDGSLQIFMTSDFTNNFVLRFSKLGIETLGINEDKLSIVRRDGVDYYYLAVSNNTDTTKNSWVDAGVLAGEAILAGNNLRSFSLFSKHSLFQTFDQRVDVNCSSHLPMASNVLIREGKQGTDRSICRAFFENKMQTSVRFDREGTFEGQQIENILYTGQHPFIKKSDFNKIYNRLSSSYGLRFFRFHIYITYRSFDVITNKWTFKPELLKIPDNKYWSISLRFVSET